MTTARAEIVPHLRLQSVACCRCGEVHEQQLLAVTLFSVTQAWNEFLYAYMFLRSAEVFTLPVGLAQLIVGDVQPWGVLMAASLLTAGPIILVYMLGQRFMVAGLTAGSVKG